VVSVNVAMQCNFVFVNCSQCLQCTVYSEHVLKLVLAYDVNKIAAY